MSQVPSGAAEQTAAPPVKAKSVVPKVLAGCGCGLVLAIGAIVWLAMTLTSGLPKVAEAFFSAVKAGDYAKAYQQTSAGFKANMTQESMKQWLEQSGLTDYAGATWHSRSVSNQQGKLQGTVKTSSGGTIPLTIELVKEADGWKIQHLEKAPAGVSTGGADKASAVPDDAGCKALTRKAMGDLAAAINAADFGAFFDGVSATWRKQTTKEDLLGAFRGFVDQKIDLSVLKTLEPQFTSPPTIDTKGVLHIDGKYPTQPSLVRFKLVFVREEGAWKLLGVNVNVVPQDEETPGGKP